MPDDRPASESIPLADWLKKLGSILGPSGSLGLSDEEADRPPGHRHDRRPHERAHHSTAEPAEERATSYGHRLSSWRPSSSGGPCGAGLIA
jgi:hypothetical protein